jgi:hypothetical protein
VLIAPLVLYSASGRFDFLTSACAHPDTTHRDALRGVAIGQKLGGPFASADQSRFGKSLFRYFCTIGQPGEIVKTDDLVLDSKDIRKPTLRDAPRERHLAALELGLAAAWAVVSRARLDSLVAFARCLAGARAWATTESLAIPVRARSRDEIVEANTLDGTASGSLRASRTRCLVCHPLSLYRRHFYEMTHVFDLSAQCG